MAVPVGPSGSTGTGPGGSAPAGDTGPVDPRDASLGELLKQLSTDTATLVRQEIALARAELTQQGKHAGKGVGMFGAAGLLGLGAFGAFTAFLIALIATALDHVWLAALIVALIYGAIAGVLALQGKKKIKEATPPAPQTVETVKEDIEWAKTRK